MTPGELLEFLASRLEIPPEDFVILEWIRINEGKVFRQVHKTIPEGFKVVVETNENPGIFLEAIFPNENEYKVKISNDISAVVIPSVDSFIEMNSYSRDSIKSRNEARMKIMNDPVLRSKYSQMITLLRIVENIMREIESEGLFEKSLFPDYDELLKDRLNLYWLPQQKEENDE